MRPSALARYGISVPETIAITVPGVAVSSGQDLPVPYNFTILPTPGSCTLEGPMVDASSEEDVATRLLNRTLVVTLHGDEWDPQIYEGRARHYYLEADESPMPEVVEALISSLRAASQAEPYGFDAVLALNRTQIRVRVPSPTQMEIDLPVTEAYSIIRPESVSLVVPAAAVLTRGSPTLERAWVILPSIGKPRVLDSAGALLESIAEAAFQANGTVLVFRISSDGFVEEVGQDTVQSVSLIDGVLSGQSEASGWNAIVRPYLTYRSLTRSADGTTVTMVVPPFDGYDVLAPETLSIHLAASVLLSGQDISVEQTIVVLATSGSASVSGSLARQGGGNAHIQPCCNREDYIQLGGSTEPPTLTITLTDDHWEPGIEYGGSAALEALVASIRSDQSEPSGDCYVAAACPVTSKIPLVLTPPPPPMVHVDLPTLHAVPSC